MRTVVTGLGPAIHGFAAIVARRQARTHALELNEA